MATVKRFEDLQCWIAARRLCSSIYEISSKGSFAKDFALRNQINASSGSIMDNIAEGFERGGNKEFIYFLSISKGSAAETKSQLYRAFDREYLSEDDFRECMQLAEEVSATIQGLINYLQKSEFKGKRYSAHEGEESYKKLEPILEKMDYSIYASEVPIPNHEKEVRKQYPEPGIKNKKI